MRAAWARRLLSARPGAHLIGAVRGGGAGAPVSAPPIAVYEDAVSAAEEEALVREASKWLDRLPFAGGHFDNVIQGYREVQKPARGFSARARAILARLTAAGGFADGAPLLPVHLLDLAADGAIGRHVDHVEYSGESIVGLSLLSHATMVLHHEATDAWLPLSLPRRSLYVLRGEARYEWAHSLPLQHEGIDPSAPPKQRRVALLFRDAPRELSVPIAK
jgi:hypothetical protein